MPDPIPEEAAAGDVIEVHRSTLYYVATAILFFVAGYILAYAVFTSSIGSLISDLKSAAIDAAQSAAVSAVATNMAHSPQLSSAVVAQPTQIPVPKQVVDTANAPSWGVDNAKVTIVEFGDFQCPYCGYFFATTYPQLEKNYKDKIKFVFRDYPLNIHPQALPAALAAQCANDQGKFWDYHDILYNSQQDLSSDGLIRYAGLITGMNIKQFTDCFTSQKYLKQILDSIKAGEGYQTIGTPTFYINGEFYAGALSYEKLSSTIDKMLAAS